MTNESKHTLYDKTEKAINRAFEVAKHSVKTVSEKAGEAALVTKLLIEKAGLEHRVSKKFAELGNKIFGQYEILELLQKHPEIGAINAIHS